MFVDRWLLFVVCFVMWCCLTFVVWRLLFDVRCLMVVDGVLFAVC